MPPMAWRRRHGPVLVLATGMVIQGLLVFWMTRDTWFHRDAWHYLTRRGLIPEADVGLFAPWGGHWQTVPVLFYRGMFAIFGVEHYRPYLLVAFALHVTICLLMYRILVRVGIPTWFAAATSWLILFFGGGSEPYMSDAPIPLTMTLVLGLTAVWLALAATPTRRHWWAITGLLLVGVMCAGMGLVFLVVVALLVAPRHGLRQAALLVVPAFAAFLVWFVLVGHDDGRVRPPGADYLTIPEYVIRGLIAVPQKLTGLPYVGLLIVLALVLLVALDRGLPTLARHLAAVGLVGAVVQMTLTAIGNPPGFGPGAGTQSRYSYLALVMLAPAIALAITAVADYFQRPGAGWAPSTLRRGFLLVCGLALLASITLQGVRWQVHMAMDQAEDSRIYRVLVLGSQAAAQAGEVPVEPILATPYNSDDLDVRWWLKPVFVESLAGEPVSARQRLDAELTFFITVTQQSLGLPPPTDHRLAGASPRIDAPGAAEPGCARYAIEPGGVVTITMSTKAGVGLGLDTDAETMTASLARDGVDDLVRRWPLDDQQFYLSTTARDARLTITLTGGSQVRVCPGPAR